MDMKKSFMSRKIFDNDLVKIRKSKVILMVNKPLCIGISYRL